mmetsp:Transcript_5856/g.11961  ORF Transcript_5856/g.11961 Transcript_5856/m.11961 type:complete len:144 (+) Transcript_5856:116-547(+)
MHEYTLLAKVRLGELLRAQGKAAEARPLLEQAVTGLEESAGPKHVSTLYAKVVLGVVLLAQGQVAEARRPQARVHAVREGEARGGAPGADLCRHSFAHYEDLCRRSFAHYEAAASARYIKAAHLRRELTRHPGGGPAICHGWA